MTTIVRPRQHANLIDDAGDPLEELRANKPQLAQPAETEPQPLLRGDPEDTERIDLSKFNCNTGGQ